MFWHGLAKIIQSNEFVFMPFVFFDLEKLYF